MTEREGQGTGIPEMTVTELNERMTRGEPIRLVDVREPHEPEIADLPPWGQELIPMREFLDRMDEIDPDEPVVVYCRSGSRSGWAVQRLLEEGYERVWNLKGGILAWREEIDPSLPSY